MFMTKKNVREWIALDAHTLIRTVMKRKNIEWKYQQDIMSPKET